MLSANPLVEASRGTASAFGALTSLEEAFACFSGGDLDCGSALLMTAVAAMMGGEVA